MCRPKSEGGLRCAAHTSKGYKAAMKPVLAGEELTAAQVSTLYTTATAYASTKTGQETIMGEIANYGKGKRDREIVSILTISAKNGLDNYHKDKEATAVIANETLRAEAIAWAKSVPSTVASLANYIKLIASDANISEAEAKVWLDNIANDFKNGVLTRKANKGQQIRFLSKGNSDRVVGTPMDPEFLDVIAEAERQLGDVRRALRQNNEPVYDDGTRWLRYEDESVSEIVRAVRYNRDTGVAHITIAPKGAELTEYFYEDVDPKIVRALVSARSMGALYGYVFSSVPNGGSLNNSTTHNYSAAIYAANDVFPIEESTGPVPRKYKDSFGFGKADKKPARKKA